MKSVLIAFHLFMVFFYLAVGAILVFSGLYTNLISGTTRLLLGILLLIYGIYRGYYVYRNYIKQQN